jgi:hypothetical protein
MEMTLNELRQEKEYGYKNPSIKSDISVDIKHIINLVKKYPNDSDLGREVRKYLINLDRYGK